MGDDKAFIRAMVGRLLTGDGREAMAHIAGADPPVGLVPCAVMMPDMDGIEVAQGYFVAKLMPADAVLGWSRTWQDSGASAL